MLVPDKWSKVIFLFSYLWHGRSENIKHEGHVDIQNLCQIAAICFRFVQWQFNDVSRSFNETVISSSCWLLFCHRKNFNRHASPVAMGLPCLARDCGFDSSRGGRIPMWRNAEALAHRDPRYPGASHCGMPHNLIGVSACIKPPKFKIFSFCRQHVLSFSFLFTIKYHRKVSGASYFLFHAQLVDAA